MDESRAAPSFGWTDALLLAVLAGALLAFYFSLRFYRPLPSRWFPRQASEFRPPAELDGARRTALAALSQDPDDLSAWTDLTIATFEEGPDHYVIREASRDKPEEMGALQLAERALELGALDDRLFYYAGAMYEDRQLVDFAVPKYENYLRHHPDDLETRLRLGNLYFRQENLEKSIESYQKVLAQKPADPLVSFNLAFALRDAKRWSEALEALTPFADGRRLPTGGHRLLGDIYVGLGDNTRALEEYKAELATSGDSLELAQAMAPVYEELGDEEAAVERWDRVLQFDTRNREARIRLRRLHRPVPARSRR